MAGIEFPSCSNEDSSEEGSTSDFNSRSFEEEYYLNLDSSNSLQEEAGAANNDAESVDDIMDKVRIKLIETGAYDRLRDLMSIRLGEAGWRLHMMSHCREFIRKKGGKVTYEVLYQSLKETAFQKVPDAVKEELLQKLKYSYESEVKEEQNKT
ncbi:transcription and mRNA export factor ENY2 [Trichonephila inaurata madagascariensis]|uniref:Transcription and mRNA export factor ENY2 n=1 Tax=Trichonephila inaurata madagascariensis TaxID=2747483 RepID=A0A8X6X9X7_9ARAC|nr:transcription and mRNA export factor ENY2 [Trichonephila inaurata madagascariensis]